MFRITVEPHNPAWARVFATTKTQLEVTFKDIPITTIEHVGSTSIPDLVAKPVIDIDIEIAASSFDPVRDALVNAGYRWIGESGIPGRHAFWQPNSGKAGTPTDGEMRRNTYVVFAGCLSLKNHRDLKRVLMQDEELRREYGQVKLDLVEDDWVETVEDYCSGKNEIASKILKKAGWSQEDLDIVTKSNFYARGMLGGV
jgi:GrpB-like predicted nucleotidyltransferase (UPF0157 family)